MRPNRLWSLGLFFLAGSGGVSSGQEAGSVATAAVASDEPSKSESSSLIGSLVGAIFGDANQNKALKAVAAAGSHEQIKAVPVSGAKGNMKLQTLTVDGQDRVLALVGQPRQAAQGSSPITSEIHVIDGDGNKKAVWQIPFHAHSLNCSPGGMVYVAGDAKVAKFDATGKMIGEVVELPHIADLLKDQKGLRTKAEKMIETQKSAFAHSVKQFKDRLAKLEAKKEEDRTKTEKAQIKQFKEILVSYNESEKYYNSLTPETVVKDLTSRLRVINGVAISDKDLFLACGESEGYGYSIWRMDLDLKNPRRILSNIGGCCGQMDIQCCGNDLLVAENTKHQFAKYDRFGKEIGRFGKSGKETEPGCFGGCCNPMNVRFTGTEVYTAESEGIIKRFAPTGEFLGMLGSVQITGGCKNVAVAASKDGTRVFFCDQPSSKVLILAPKASKKS